MSRYWLSVVTRCRWSLVAQSAFKYCGTTHHHCQLLLFRVLLLPLSFPQPFCVRLSATPSGYRRSDSTAQRHTPTAQHQLRRWDSRIVIARWTARNCLVGQPGACPDRVDRWLIRTGVSPWSSILGVPCLTSGV